MKFPFLILTRKRYLEIMADVTADAYNEGYKAAMDIKAEVAKSRRAITKPKKGRP